MWQEQRDFGRHVTLATLEQAGGISLLAGLSSVRVGGLRAGWGGTVGQALVLHGYSYVPGVTVSGRLSPAGGVLRVGGSAAVHGVLRIGAHGALTGDLGGQRVHIALPPRSTGLSLSDSASFSSLGSSALRTSTRHVARLRMERPQALLHQMLAKHP